MQGMPQWQPHPRPGPHCPNPDIGWAACRPRKGQTSDGNLQSRFASCRYARRSMRMTTEKIGNHHCQRVSGGGSHTILRKAGRPVKTTKEDPRMGDGEESKPGVEGLSRRTFLGVGSASLASAALASLAVKAQERTDIETAEQDHSASN